MVSLCSGIDMSRVAANLAGYEYDAWVSVENDPKTRKLAIHMASKDDKPSPTYIAPKSDGSQNPTTKNSLTKKSKKNLSCITVS